MTPREPPEYESPDSPNDTSADIDLWLRQFINQLELNALDASREIPAEAPTQAWRLATAHAIVETFLDSGMEIESVVELLGQATVQRRTAEIVWNDESNRRRFTLIDKDIQGSLTPAEAMELAGLTKIMREHVDSEANLPMKGARALHRKLLQLESMGQTD